MKKETLTALSGKVYTVVLREATRLTGTFAKGEEVIVRVEMVSADAEIRDIQSWSEKWI